MDGMLHAVRSTEPDSLGRGVAMFVCLFVCLCPWAGPPLPLVFLSSLRAVASCCCAGGSCAVRISKAH